MRISFPVDYYENDISLITIGDTDQFLLLPEGMSAPVGLPDSIKNPPETGKNIYLVATSRWWMILSGLDAMDLIALSGTKDTGFGIRRKRKRQWKRENCLCRKVQRSGLREDLKQ